MFPHGLRIGRIAANNDVILINCFFFSEKTDELNEEELGSLSEGIVTV